MRTARRLAVVGRGPLLRGGVQRGLVVALATAGALALASCSTTSHGSSGMMGTTAPGGGTSRGMMGDGSGGQHHFSQLSCRAPAALPGTLVTVVLGDMGMTQMMGGTAPMGARMMLRATPTSVPAGKVSLVAENMGWRTHELVVLPISQGASAGQRIAGADGKVAEASSLGEASNSCAPGAGQGITARSAGWTTITLKPGPYELICNLPNHYADGMHAELTVT